MSAVPSQPNISNFGPSGFKRPLRRRRQLNVFGPTKQPFGDSGGGGDTVGNLVRATARFGPITPVDLFSRFSQAGPDPRDRRVIRQGEEQQAQPVQPQAPPQAPQPAQGPVAQFQGDIAPKIGGPATAIALANLDDSSQPVTNPLRNNIRQG